MRANSLLVVVGVGACLGLAAVNALASKPQDRDGFYLGFGFGVGVAAWDWTDPDLGDGPSEWSGTFSFRTGIALRRDLVVGVELRSWAKRWTVLTSSGIDLGTATVSLGTLTLGATYFPGNIGLYVRGGVGAAIGRSDVDEITATLLQVPGETTEFGPALLAAVGYEWRVTDRFAVGPQVEITYAAIDGDLIGEPLVVDGSIQFNWYW